MPKPKRKKNTSFQNAMTKAVFLYGRPNKEKRTCIQQMLDTYIRMVNTYIRLLNSRSDLLLTVMKNSRKDSSLRQLEKSVRPEGVNSAFSQNAFDEAVVHLSKRYCRGEPDCVSRVKAQRRPIMCPVGCLTVRLAAPAERQMC